MVTAWQIESLGTWTRPVTDPRASSGRFRATWDQTLKMLVAEIDLLQPTSAIAIQVDADPADIRRDGMLRARAKVDFPGVVVSFTSALPGKNYRPIPSELTQEEWIQYARPVWHDVRETDVLGVHQARENDDERHLCPLQLPVIERCVRLWSGPGETVLSPFAGVGSEGHEAVRLGRRFVGVELKPSYFRVAARNLRRIESNASAEMLFDLAEVGA